MKCSLKKGFSFGLTSGIITTLGLIVGLNSGTHSNVAIIAGVFVIAVADAMSDAMGMHISEECINTNTTQQVWASTAATFCAKFFFALTFVVPILLLPLTLAIIVSVIWGVFLIALFSFFIAKQQGANPLKVIFEHVALTIAVVILTNYIGVLVSKFT